MKILRRQRGRIFQLEVNAWQKSKYIIPDDLKEEFDKFNLRIIDSYKHKFSKERENDS
jgi:hypothetical protein